MKFIKSLFIVFAAAISTAAIAQQEYPTKPVKLIVPFAAGGAVDLLGRLMGQALSDASGQSFIVDNKPGAGGLIAMNEVAKAAPDGYTLGVGSSGTLTVSPILFPNAKFDPLKDVDPVIWYATSGGILVVRKDLNAKTVQDLMALSKANPGKLNMASAGSGSILHLMGEYFMSINKVNWTHVPYKGSAPALTDMIAGRVDVMVDSVPSAGPHIKSGAIRAMGVTTAKRASELPDVPTLQEVGYKDFDVGILYGIVAPKGTPKNIIARLNSDLQKSLQKQEVQARLIKNGYEAEGGPPENMSKRVAADLERWRTVIRTANVKVQ
jgi:tripartite-type tricarboxylate transporter receptor subunit TctC